MSVLTLSVILAVALTIIGAVLKELKISASSQNSVTAVYAADSGIECALLWDIRGAEFYQPAAAPAGYYVFPTSTAAIADRPTSPIPDGTENTIMCYGIDIADIWTFPTQTANSAVSRFILTIPPGDSCAIVEVTKTVVGSRTDTIILSRGYNAGCGTYLTDPNAVERAIEVEYIFN